MQRLLAVGFAIVIAGMILLIVGAAGQGSLSAGGVVFIGPFPIVFGSGQNGSELALISLMIGAIMVGFTLLWVRSTRLP